MTVNVTNIEMNVLCFQQIFIYLKRPAKDLCQTNAQSKLLTHHPNDKTNMV